MCLSGIFGGGGDNSAEQAAKKAAKQAKQAEAQRQASITQGQGAIDSTFGKFGDSFYQGIAKDYTGYYEPQLDQQYEDARKNLIFGLARSGNLDASAGADQLGRLLQSYTDNQAQIGQRAQAAASTARSSVDQAKAQLYGDLSSSADPAAAAKAAIAQAGALSAPQTYSPLGQLFANFAQQGATAVGAAGQGYQNWTSPLFNAPNRSAATVVG